MKLTPCGLVEEGYGRGQKPKKIRRPWLSAGKTVRRSAHHRKRCIYCNEVYYRSRRTCPVCGFNLYKLRSH